MVGYAHIGQGAYEKPLCHLLNFVVNLKLFLKKKSFKFMKKKVSVYIITYVCVYLLLSQIVCHNYVSLGVEYLIFF